MVSTQYCGSVRQARNDMSRDLAEHHTEPWLRQDDEFLVAFFTLEPDGLFELAETLARTVEACRQRYYLVVRGEATYGVRATRQYRGWTEDMGDG